MDAATLARRSTTLVVFSEGGADGGSPCPVVLDADDLSADDMQAVARHLGLESAFVLAPTEGEADVRLRYFVPEHEMEMCVHATVAAISLLVTEDRVTTGRPLRVETPLGVLRAEAHEDGSVEVEQLLPTFDAVRHDAVADLAAVMSCDAARISTAADQPAAVSVSRSKLLVELDAPETLHRLSVDGPAVGELCDLLGVTGLYPWASEGPGTYLARQFPAGSGYVEDAATGLAAAALGALLATREADDGSFDYRVRQGQDLGRPSVIGVLVDRVGSRVSRVAVRGRAQVRPPSADPRPA